MISRQEFGRTEHQCSRVILGAWALNKATQTEADRIMTLLHDYGVNSIDTAPMYGNAEKVIGPWLTERRKEYFVATKTRSRSRQGALKNLSQSLEHLQVDYIDLWQMHGLTNPAGWEKAMGPDGALEALVEARDDGLVHYLGVTGHGYKAPSMHKLSLERFDFDSIMLPHNYLLMQNPHYEADFLELVELCKKRKVAVQTIKSIARSSLEGQSKRYNTYFYEPLETQDAIDKSVHWSLGLLDSFLISVGDLRLLPKVLNTASSFEERPSELEMRAMVNDFKVQSIWSRSKRGKGPHTWGGKMYQIVEKLIREGFFSHPKKRTLEQVVFALESNGLPSRDKKKNLANALTRRAKKGILKKTKTPNGWVYWTE